MREGRLPRVRVEFYGLARLRAGRAAVEVEAATLGEALAAADAACPNLAAVRDGHLSPAYLVMAAGAQFTSDMRWVLGEGETVSLFGADAGG